MDVKDDIVNSPNAKKLVKFNHEINLNIQAFHYPEKEDPSIKEFQLLVKKGEAVALVGSSGAGKTTIANLIPRFYDVTRGIRRLGAASLDLCFVAMGRFDGYYEYSLKPWDICAGSLIAEEAGAIVSDWDNSLLPNNGSRILATNGLIHNKMVNVLTQNKYKLFF